MSSFYPRLLFAFLVLTALVSCADSPPPIPTGPPDQTYRLRGKIESLPKEPKAGSEVSIYHEAVPDFVSPTGKVIGMEAMTMPFPIADPAQLAGLAAGDKVEFQLEVRWDEDVPALVSQLSKLPPDTRLAFEASGDAAEDAGEDAAEDVGAPEPGDGSLQNG